MESLIIPGRLPELKRCNGIDFHIALINLKIESERDPLAYIDQYLSELRHSRKDSTVRTIAFGIKSSLKRVLGTRYKTDANINHLINAVLAPYTGRPINPSIRFLLEDEEVVSLADGTPIGRICALLAHSGLRIQELLSIKLSEIRSHSDGYSEILIHGKGKKDRLILVSTEYINELINTFKGKIYLIEKDGQPMIRQTIASRLRYHSQRRIGRIISPHDFRRWWATTMVETHPEKIKSIIDYGGWRDSNVFMKHYVKQKMDPIILPSLRRAI